MAAIYRSLSFMVFILLGLFHRINSQQSNAVDASPFFFHCTQFDRWQDDWDTNQSATEIAQVELSGNPGSYIGGQVYKVTVRLTEDFDSALITGVYSTTPSGLASKQYRQRKMCTILHSYAKRRPTDERKIDFRWMAPPEDMGCVHFVGTFRRQETLVLKDRRIYHLCPATDELEAGSVTLSGVNQKGGVVFRDDFETGHFSPSLWSESEGFQVSNSCQPVFHGLSATLCSRMENMSSMGEDHSTSTVVRLSSVALNLTSAGTLQFTIGQTSCSVEKQNTTSTTGFNANITIFYGQLISPYDTACSNWSPFRTITSLSGNRESASYVIPLSSSIRQPETCFRWSVQLSREHSHICFAIDEVIVTNLADRPLELHADFDPFNTADWLSLPGGKIHRGCRGSKGAALVFNSNHIGPNWASTSDLQLASSLTSDQILWKPDFNELLPDEHWEFQNARIEANCENDSRHLVLQQTFNSSFLSACSPLLDLSLAGNLRFHLEPSNTCKKPTKNTKTTKKTPQRSPSKLNVWIEHNDGSKRRITIVSGLFLDKEPVKLSLAVPSEAQEKDVRICWQLMGESHSNEEASPWAVNDILLHPALPSPIQYVLQFRLNMACDSPEKNYSTSVNLPLKGNEAFRVMVQYSNDHGSSWNNLHGLCLPPTCTGDYSNVIQTTWSSQEMVAHPWERITLPIPFTSLADHVRFRFIQKGRGFSNGDIYKHWALDDIYIEECYLGCSGHGTCVEKGHCSCDDGYQGEWCQFPTQPLPSVFRENFEQDTAYLEEKFARLTGKKLGERCGQVGAGIAAIFDEYGDRQLVTFDLDTTESHIVRFAIRMNGPGSQHRHHCPGPDRPVEIIYVHSSCNGGITWSLLKFIQPQQTKEESTQLIRIQLPSDAQGPSCRFRIWQAQHSGAGKDVWAVDDLYIGPNLTDTLIRNSSFSNVQPTTADAFVGRHLPEEFCKRDGVMILQADELEETYPVRIEPFSVVQLESAVGCSSSTPLLNNNSVIVQFSIDGGKHWNNLDNSQRHVSFLQNWRRIGIKLPPASWSEATRFRIAQTGSRTSDRSPLGIDYFYAGPDECPELCRGNGRCSLSGCVCDDGFSRENCLPDLPLATLKGSDDNNALVIGGHQYATDRDGCLVRGTHNIMFDGLGMRLLETKEIVYSPGIVVMFFLRLGFCEPSQAASHDIFVQLEVSWNGIDWKLLREYRSPFFWQPQLEQIEIVPPESLKSKANPPPFRMRFVQTGVHGKDRNVWSLSGLTSSSQAEIFSGLDIGKLSQPLNENADFWLVRNEPDPKSSCLVFDANCPSRIVWYGALTKKVFLDVGDTIQFDIVTQRFDSTSFPDTSEQILVEYSADGGVDWQLVQPECLHSWSNCLGFHQSSRLNYRSLKSEEDGVADRFHFSASESMANKPILLRWLHHRLGDQQHHPLRGFQIQNLYIGRPCPSLCSGHGRCWQSACTCDVGYTGENCAEAEESKPAGFYDTFVYKEHTNSTPNLRPHWGRIVGGKLLPNYCDGSTDGVVFFGGRGPRSLQTIEIDTRNLRMVQFTLAVTSIPIYKQNCRLATKRKSLATEIPAASLLVLDYSNDNGLTWNPLETWPLNTEVDEKRLGFNLPDSARTPRTIIRWWQLTYPNTNHRDGLQWYLDDVLVNLNITNPAVFEYDIQSDAPIEDQQSSDIADIVNSTDGTITDWMGWQGLIFREQLDPVDTLLGPTDLEDGFSLSYAETWDMEISDPTFVQFQLILPEHLHSGAAEVRFEYSTDMGRRWNMVEEGCYRLDQLSQQCEYLHPPSRYLINNENNATRITVHLPKRSITESTRFRWISENGQNRGPMVWGVARVYIGGTCPWMCSGHGTCQNGKCNCDAGYGNVDCVPINPLPRDLLSHFDKDSNLVRLSGGDISTGCGVLTSGPAAIFHKDGLRYFESKDLDLTAASYAQMTIKFHCWAEAENYANSLEPLHQRLLLQYSVNGGITWILIQEIKILAQHDPQLVIVNFMRIPDLTNCTRLRLWQPVHAGEGLDTWAIDGLVLHSTTPFGVFLTSDFQQSNDKDFSWLAWFGGQLLSFCSRDDALVFPGELGEQQVFTGDSMITSETVLQFEVNVGCGTIDLSLERPVRLEYSIDGGQRWHLVVNDSSRNPYNRMSHQTSTVYSSKTTNAWKTETVMLSHLETSKPIRFRWYQGFFNGTDGHLAPQWAIRNVILSPQCPELCNGHGRCTIEGFCECDEGYQGEACETVKVLTLNPRNIHELFVQDDAPENSLWLRQVGGELRAQPSSKVGIGGAFVMDRLEVKMLETRDLDLSNANFVQFHLDSSDSVPSEDEIFVVVEYSINGGIEWTTFEVIPLSGPSFQQLRQVPLPSRARSLAARLKWSQLGGNHGNLQTVWSIDEIYVGGEYYAKSAIEDDFTSLETTKNNWLFVSGGSLEPSCGSSNTTLHFASNPNGKSMAMTKDIRVTDQMFLQYAISSGCDHPNSCNHVRLEYSDNYGLVWRNLPDECLPGEAVDCDAFEFHSELLSQVTGYQRTITAPIPLNKGVVRLRWISDDESIDWSLHWVYVGGACGHCNGRGRCWKGSCQCYAGWNGNNCEISSTELLSSVRETFSNGWNSSVWSRVNGGSVSSLCGTLDSGPALHFHDACGRYAETRELDLHQVPVIQFHLRSGCGQLSSIPNQGILLFQYSLNGGVKWHTGLSLSLDYFQDSRLVSYLVPEEAQKSDVKLRWWQLGHSDRMSEDWAIDSFIIDRPLDVSVASDAPEQRNIHSRELSPDYQGEESVDSTHPKQFLNILFGQKLWWRKVNVDQHDSYCGRRGHIMRGRSNTAEESVLETSDFSVANAKGHILSFEMLVGDCGQGSDSIELAAVPIKLPVRLEISYDHGITWKLFHPMKVRGENGPGPQIPSVYQKLDKWQTYQYSLEIISGARFARFRWRHPKSSAPVSWAVNEFDMGPAIKDPLLVGLDTLADDFNDGSTVKPHWKFFSGGKIANPNERLGDGAAGLFQGPGIKLLQTVPLDLIFGRNVEFILNFQLGKGRKDLEDVTQNVFLQCSPDNGFKWILIQDYLPQHYIHPAPVHAVIPEDCQNPHSILRWWQPVVPEASSEAAKKHSVWLIDNIAIEYSKEHLSEIYDDFADESFNQTQWQFHPNGVISNNFCGTPETESSMNFVSSENSRFAGITSRHITVKDFYAAYFKIRTSCGITPCHANHNRSQVRFEMRQGYEQPYWSLVKPNCLPSSTDSLCDPQMYHSSSALAFSNFPTWQRVIIPLKSIPFANTWQFRWMTQKNGKEKGEKNIWALKDVYIGRMCPSHCHGHGDCIRGRCHCDNGYEGVSCSTSKAVLVASSLPIMDHFDDLVNPPLLWESITGGSIKVGCGSLIPLAHGKHLHFDGCGIRMAITVPIDVRVVRRLAFVIRIGTPQQIPSCRIQSSNTYRSDTLDRIVLLQYSYNSVDWFLLASHGIRNFIQPQRMIYYVPVQTNSSTIQFRWWQPQHGGPTWDQWALDNVEILI